MSQETINILFNFLPEITAALTVLILNIFTGSDKKGTRLTYYIFVIGIVASAMFSFAQAYYAPQQLLSGMFCADHYSYAGRAIMSSVMAISAVSFFGGKSKPHELSLSLVSYAGALLTVSASNIFMLFISMQVMLIPLYLLTHYTIKPVIRYFVFSSLFTAIMLYGITLLYGLTGSGEYTSISKFLSFNPFNTLILVLSFVLIITGLAFVSLLAPFNLSFPVFSNKLKNAHLVQFTIINVTAVLFAAGRFIYTAFQDHNTFITTAGNISFIGGVNWKLMLAVISVCSILAGNLVILWQYDLKKITVYIIISQTGYLLTGIISGSQQGLAAMLAGAVILAVNSIGLFYCVELINSRYNVTETSGLKGLGRSDKLLFIAFIFFLSSSAGFPLTSGFNSKLILYSLPGMQGYFWLIAAGIFSSAVFLFFIFRLLVVLFTGKNAQNPPKIGTGPLIILLILLFPAIFFSIFISPLLNWANYCSNLFGI
ncbi:MAG TPA: proton-conducting transporter membrane subunit [Ignavibacteria bacterium]|nr:proton-conducting transporter membrane subunit [Ignavibacteria bacterium]HMQ98281.1 proton-conducting transporter membrane subunit [Ignavibacteria bacterium]